VTMDATTTEAPELVLADVKVVRRGACWAVASDGDHAVLHSTPREAVAAHYDQLAETAPQYAGMWRATARILRRGGL